MEIANSFCEARIRLGNPRMACKNRAIRHVCVPGSGQVRRHKANSRSDRYSVSFILHDHRKMAVTDDDSRIANLLA